MVQETFLKHHNLLWLPFQIFYLLFVFYRLLPQKNLLIMHMVEVLALYPGKVDPAERNGWWSKVTSELCGLKHGLNSDLPSLSPNNLNLYRMFASMAFGADGQASEWVKEVSF